MPASRLSVFFKILVYLFSLYVFLYLLQFLWVFSTLRLFSARYLSPQNQHESSSNIPLFSGNKRVISWKLKGIIMGGYVILRYRDGILHFPLWMFSICFSFTSRNNSWSSTRTSWLYNTPVSFKIRSIGN